MDQSRDPDEELWIDEVHDNFVYATSLHLEAGVLVLHTRYRDGDGYRWDTHGNRTGDGPYPYGDVRFTGVVAHHFDQIMAPSILLAVYECGPEYVVKLWRPLFEAGRGRLWPFQFDDLTGLLETLAARGVRGFQVMGTLGMDGFVLAAEVRYCPRSGPADPSAC